MTPRTFYFLVRLLAYLLTYIVTGKNVLDLEMLYIIVDVQKIYVRGK